MSNDRNKRRLLTDILAEESEPGLRDAIVGQTLRLVRRKRRFRAVRRVGSVAAIFMLSVLLTFHFLRPRPPSITTSPPRPESGYALIRTQPLNQAMIVATRPFFSSAEVASTASVDVVTTRELRPAIVELSDDQLLDLAKGAPVALVRHGPHQAELIFANDDDREKLFHN